MTELLLVRHGLSAGNAAGIVQGQMETELTAHGEVQAQAVGRRLRDFLPIAALYSSDLVRAVRTAEMIAEEIGLTPIQEPGLREMHFGSLQGMSGSDWKMAWPDLAAAEAEDSLSFQWPGGESRRQFGERIETTIERLVASHPPDSRLVVVSHGALISTYLGYLLTGAYSGYRGYFIHNCSLTHVLLNAGEPQQIVLEPDAQHLDGLLDEQQLNWEARHREEHRQAEAAKGQGLD